MFHDDVLISGSYFFPLVSSSHNNPVAHHDHWPPRPPPIPHPLHSSRRRRCFVDFPLADPSACCCFPPIHRPSHYLCRRRSTASACARNRRSVAGLASDASCSRGSYPEIHSGKLIPPFSVSLCFTCCPRCCLHSLVSRGCRGRLTSSIRDSGLGGRDGASPRSLRSAAVAPAGDADMATTMTRARTSRNAGPRGKEPNLMPRMTTSRGRLPSRSLSVARWMPLLKVTASVRIAEDGICCVG